MSDKRIAFQGEPGAYSEEALYLLHPDAASQPQREFRDVAEAVLARRAEYGLLPIENSLVGSVATNFDLIAESGLRRIRPSGPSQAKTASSTVPYS